MRSSKNPSFRLVRLRKQSFAFLVPTVYILQRMARSSSPTGAGGRTPPAKKWPWTWQGAVALTLTQVVAVFLVLERILHHQHFSLSGDAVLESLSSLAQSPVLGLSQWAFELYEALYPTVRATVLPCLTLLLNTLSDLCASRYEYRGRVQVPATWLPTFYGFLLRAHVEVRYKCKELDALRTRHLDDASASGTWGRLGRRGRPQGGKGPAQRGQRETRGGGGGRPPASSAVHQPVLLTPPRDHREEFVSTPHGLERKEGKELRTEVEVREGVGRLEQEEHKVNPQQQQIQRTGQLVGLRTIDRGGGVRKIAYRTVRARVSLKSLAARIRGWGVRERDRSKICNQEELEQDEDVRLESYFSVLGTPLGGEITGKTKLPFFHSPVRIGPKVETKKLSVILKRRDQSEIQLSFQPQPEWEAQPMPCVPG